MSTVFEWILTFTIVPYNGVSEDWNRQRTLSPTSMDDKYMVDWFLEIELGARYYCRDRERKNNEVLVAIRKAVIRY